jgi:hypothetical protein
MHYSKIIAGLQEMGLLDSSWRLAERRITVFALLALHVQSH